MHKETHITDVVQSTHYPLAILSATQCTVKIKGEKAILLSRLYSITEHRNNIRQCIRVRKICNITKIAIRTCFMSLSRTIAWNLQSPNSGEQNLECAVLYFSVAKAETKHYNHKVRHSALFSSVHMQTSYWKFSLYVPFIRLTLLSWQLWHFFVFPLLLRGSTPQHTA